jgi:integrase/recombinase XerD
MKFTDAIDDFFLDMRQQGRIKSKRTEVSYRRTLELHAEDVGNRDPRYTNRDDVKKTLRRWTHPNTIYTNRAALVSFYRWTVWEGLRKDNPADQVAPPRKVEADVYRMTWEEVRRFLTVALAHRDRWLTHVGVLAGPRRQELRGFQGRHFQRDDFIWISRDIGKGGRERFIPVLDDLKDVVAEIRASVALDHYVFPAQRWRNPNENHIDRTDLHEVPASEQAIWNAVRRLAKAAGIYGNVTPHSMRHAFGDHIARGTDVRVAQFLLGHADLGTTETYLGAPSLDQMARASRASRSSRSAAPRWRSTRTRSRSGSNARSRGFASWPESQ